MIYLILFMVFVHFAVFFYYVSKLNDSIKGREFVDRR
jgi:hypothetical protein